MRAAAQRRLAQAEATALYELVWDPDAPPVKNAVEALHRMAGQMEHSAKVLGARISTEGLDGPSAIAWNQVLGHQRRLLADIARLGIEERIVELEQERAELVVNALRTALDLLGLSPGDRSRVIQGFLHGLGRGTQELAKPTVPGELA